MFSVYLTWLSLTPLFPVSLTPSNQPAVPTESVFITHSKCIHSIPISSGITTHVRHHHLSAALRQSPPSHLMSPWWQQSSNCRRDCRGPAEWSPLCFPQILESHAVASHCLRNPMWCSPVSLRLFFLSLSHLLLGPVLQPSLPFFSSWASPAYAHLYSPSTILLLLGMLFHPSVP